MSTVDKSQLRILVCDDDDALREVIATVLLDDGYQVVVAANGAEARQRMREVTIDLALVDLRMPDIEGTALMPLLQQVEPDLAIVMMTAYGSIKTAVEAIRQGASDFLTKPFDLEEMKLTVHNALILRQLSRENRELRHLIVEDGREFPEICGNSPRIREVFTLMKRVAGYDVTVLITGESGTGKELVARALHHGSPRAKGPFVAINCAALPETLLEAELFGHEKGAFTGAAGTRMGRFELAHGGTLFLDEVGDMSPAMQVRLLRVLQEGEFERVGGGVAIKTDVRLLTATNKDLRSEVAAHRFREDLFYRLNVVALHLPPLRERIEDLPVLASRFLADYGTRYGRAELGIAADAMDCLLAHDWPGNIRELKHLVEQAVILGDGPLLRAADLPLALRRPEMPQLVAPVDGDLEGLEKKHIRSVLDQCNWNRNRAAEILGLHRNTLREKIRRYGLECT